MKLFLGALLFLAAILGGHASAACKADSFIVHMEFPDGSSYGRGTGSPATAGEMTANMTRIGLAEPEARRHAEDFIKALDLFSANPDIKRAELNAKVGGDGRAYVIRHWCDDDVAHLGSFPRTVGYLIREDTSAPIWVKNRPL